MLDSNLIIDAARPEYPGLRRLIAARPPAVSAFSLVEVLGYHNLSKESVLISGPSSRRPKYSR